MTEASLRYAPSSPYAKSVGYINSLAPQQKLAFEELQHQIISRSINLNDVAFNFLHPSLVLLRYLRANNFDVLRAIQHIDDSISWRKSFGIDRLCETPPEEVLGTDIQLLMNILPHWHCGCDKFGRPIIYRIYTNFDSSKLGELYSLEALLRYHVWEQEASARLCLMQSLRSGYIVETIVGVIDVGGMHIRQVDAFFMSVVKDIALIDQQRYPESLGQIFIVNAPSIFSVVWRLVRGFLDPVVKSKIFIFGTSRPEWEASLIEHIGYENLSSTYGGGAQALSVDMHPYQEIMSTWPRPDALLTGAQSLSAQPQWHHGAAAAASNSNSLPDTSILPRPYEQPHANFNSLAEPTTVLRPFSLASPLYVHSVAATSNVDEPFTANPFSPSLSSPSASDSSSISSSSSSSVSPYSQSLRGDERARGELPGGAPTSLSALSLALRTYGKGKGVQSDTKLAAYHDSSQLSKTDALSVGQSVAAPSAIYPKATESETSQSDLSPAPAHSTDLSRKTGLSELNIFISDDRGSNSSISEDDVDMVVNAGSESRVRHGHPAWLRGGASPPVVRLLGHADWAAELEFLKHSCQESEPDLLKKQKGSFHALDGASSNFAGPVPAPERMLSYGFAAPPAPEIATANTFHRFVVVACETVLNVFLSSWSYIQTLYLLFKFRRHLAPARALSTWLFHPLRSRSIMWIRSVSIRVIVTSIALSCALLAISVYALAVLTDAASLRLEMWTGVLAVLLFSVTLLINVTGLFGVYLENQYLLIIYMSCIAFVMVLCLLVAVTSSVFLSGSEVIRSYRNKALNGFRAGQNAQVLLDRHNIIMAASAWAIFAFSALPLYLSAAFVLQLRRNDRTASRASSSADFFARSVTSRAGVASTLTVSHSGSSSSVLEPAEAPADASIFGDERFQTCSDVEAADRFTMGPQSATSQQDMAIVIASASSSRRLGLGPDRKASKPRSSDRVSRDSSDDWVQWINGVPKPRPHSLAHSLEMLLHMLFRLLHVRHQMRVAMITSLIICLIIAFGMIGYGGYAIDFLFRIQFSYTISTAYLLLCCGISLSIFAGFAIWATVADHKSAIWVYKNVAIPMLSIFILACAALSFGMLHSCGARLRDDHAKGIIKTSDLSVTRDIVDVQLLIEGLLGFNVVFFQAVCFACCSELIDVLSRLEECLVKIREIVIFHNELSGMSTTQSNRAHRFFKHSRAGAPLRMRPFYRRPVNCEHPPPRSASHKQSLKLALKFIRPPQTTNASVRRAAHASPWLDESWVSDVCAAAQAPYTEADDAQIRLSHSYLPSLPLHSVPPSQMHFDQRCEFEDNKSNECAQPLSPRLKTRSYSFGVRRDPNFRADDGHIRHELLDLALAYYRRWEHRKSQVLSFQDRLAILWGVLIACIFIYVKGTFVMFSNWMKKDFSPNWILLFWRMLAKSDRRYANAETFFVAKEAFLAVIVGPSAGMFAWAVFARSRWRHVLGLLASCTELSAILLVLAVEIRSKFNEITLADPAVLALVVVAFDAVRLICVLAVFIYEARSVHSKDSPFRKHF